MPAMAGRNRKLPAVAADACAMKWIEHESGADFGCAAGGCCACGLASSIAVARWRCGAMLGESSAFCRRVRRSHRIAEGLGENREADPVDSVLRPESQLGCASGIDRFARAGRAALPRPFA